MIKLWKLLLDNIQFYFVYYFHQLRKKNLFRCICLVVLMFIFEKKKSEKFTITALKSLEHRTVTVAFSDHQNIAF